MAVGEVADREPINWGGATALPYRLHLPQVWRGSFTHLLLGEQRVDENIHAQLCFEPGTFSTNYPATVPTDSNTLLLVA